MIADGGPGRFGGFEIGDEIYVLSREHAGICYTFEVDDVAPELLTEQYNRDRRNFNGLNQGGVSNSSSIVPMPPGGGDHCAGAQEIIWWDGGAPSVGCVGHRRVSNGSLRFG